MVPPPHGGWRGREVLLVILGKDQSLATPGVLPGCTPLGRGDARGGLPLPHCSNTTSSYVPKCQRGRKGVLGPPQTPLGPPHHFISHGSQ